jgi:hypothetical protein
MTNMRGDGKFKSFGISHGFRNPAFRETLSHRQLALSGDAQLRRRSSSD